MPQIWPTYWELLELTALIITAPMISNIIFIISINPQTTETTDSRTNNVTINW